MDPERQPLLGESDLRCRRLRPLTHDEVFNARNEASWRRARFCLVLMFWAIMAMFLSIIVCILVTTTKCRSFDVDMTLLPSVPPVHLSFSSIVSSGKAKYNDAAYTI